MGPYTIADGRGVCSTARCFGGLAAAVSHRLLLVRFFDMSTVVGDVARRGGGRGWWGVVSGLVFGDVWVLCELLGRGTRRDGAVPPSGSSARR